MSEIEDLRQEIEFLRNRLKSQAEHKSKVYILQSENGVPYAYQTLSDIKVAKANLGDGWRLFEAEIISEISEE